MLVPVRWLKEYVHIDLDTKELADKMTLSGSNVEIIKEVGRDIEGVVIGKILEIGIHPNADKLVIVKVDIGHSQLQIVTGADNIKVGDYVPVAVHGAKLPGDFKIKKGKLRGEISEGMLCSQDELDIPKSVIPVEEREGIWILEKPYPLGKNLLEVIELQDDVIEFEITSNRPDCLSMIGMAREVAATIDSQLKYPEIRVRESEKDSSNEIKVIIEDKKGCERYIARVIEDVKIEPSPQWMQRRLANAGIRPINNIVDITNYVMLEYGQPLHAFDAEYIKGNTIVVRSGKSGEVFKTLDKVDRKIEDNMTMICDIDGPLAIGGVMGGEESEVTPQTKKIVLESAYFEPESIRLTSKQLGLRTEASSRFEKGLDPRVTRSAVDRACQLIEELGAGTVLSGAVDMDYTNKEERSINIRPDRINKILGLELSNEEIGNILNKLEIKVEYKDDATLNVIVPSYRIDLENDADFSEEVARIYGYNNIPSTMARTDIVAGAKTNGQIIEDLTKDSLTAMGLNEILTYSFVSPKGLDRIGLSKDSVKGNYIKLINPLGDETSAMRTTLIPNLLDVMTRNFNRKVENFKAFEIGRIFIPRTDEGSQLPHELLNLVIGSYGEGDFYTLKGMVEGLFKILGIKGYSYEVEKHHPTYHPGRCGNIVWGEHILGTLGEVHPKVMEGYGITERAYCAELDFELLLQLTRLDTTYTPLPKYPSISRDFAMVLKDNILVKEIEDIIVANGGGLLEEYKLFDLYKGDQIPDGYKSIAYGLTYRHRERTLKDEEVNLVHEQILKEIEGKLGASLRD